MDSEDPTTTSSRGKSVVQMGSPWPSVSLGKFFSFSEWLCVVHLIIVLIYYRVKALGVGGGLWIC